MSWISKGLKSIGKVFKPIEKAVRPLVKGAAQLVPGGGALLDLHRKIKSSIYDPLRRGGAEGAEVKAALGAGIERRIDAAQVAIGSVNAAENAALTARQNPMLVAVVVGMMLLAVGFGRRR